VPRKYGTFKTLEVLNDHEIETYNVGLTDYFSWYEDEGMRAL
jgi:hypothetical protein